MTPSLFYRHIKCLFVKCWDYQTESVWSVPENTSLPCWGLKTRAADEWQVFLGLLNDNKEPEQIKNEPEKQV